MEKSKEFLNHAWLKSVDETYSDFITDLIADEVTTPHLVINGEKIQTCDCELYDCYFDENGDLYAPTEYRRTYAGGYTDSEGRYQNEDEYEADAYEIFKTKAELETLFTEYKKDHE